MLKRLTYQLLWFIITPLLPFALILRAKKDKRYLQHISERFALNSLKQSKPVILLHAVSVGENIAAKPLITELTNIYPDHQIVISCTTVTGRAWIASNHDLPHHFLPYDAPWFMAMYFAKLKPQMVIVMETEVWPNLIAACHKRAIPIVLANARLSEKSYQGYVKAGKWFEFNWHKIDLALAQAAADQSRLQALGCKTVLNSGNIKLDQQQRPALNPEFSAWQQQLSTRTVWIAASTHSGEDEIILNAHMAVLAKHSNALLILVPRHKERFNEVAKLCQNLNLQKRSSKQAIASDTQVWLLDSIGELTQAMQLANLAFIGGSFSGTGGHNPVEALVAGCKVAMGPSQFNFAAICQSLIQENLLTSCENQAELSDWLEQHITSAADNSKAQVWLEAQKGSLARQVQAISDCYSSSD